MGIGDFFAKINTYLQDKYTGMSDFLSNKGIPLNKFNDFLESHGIPAMWSAIAILLLIIVIIALITLLVFKSSLILHVSFEDTGRNALDNVFLTLSLGDSQLYSQIANVGDIEIEGVSTGDVLKVNAVLDGYRLVSPTEIVVDGKEQTVSFVLDKQINVGTMQLRLIDKKTQTTIANADVNIKLADGQILSGRSDESGIISFSGVPLGQPINIRILKDGYLEFEELKPVQENGITDISLEPNDLVCSDKGQITFKVSAISQPIEDAKIIIYSMDSKKIAEELTDPEGKAAILLPKCQALRYVVSKDGYITFDSKDTNKNLTVMQNTETRNVYLDIGGSKITVVIKDDSGKEIVGANVALYSENGLIVDSNMSNIYGQVEFTGLDIKRGLFVSANYPNYYPNSISIDKDTIPPYDLVLKKIDITKAAKVQLFVANIDNKPIANAIVEMFKVTDTKELPIYLADNKTAITGFLGVILDPETNLKINASTQELFGSKTQQLISGDNKFEIVMTPNQKINTLYVYGITGQILKDAKLTIRTQQQVLFDGNTGEKGKAEFIAGSAKEVEATVIDDQGNVYSKLLTVNDKMELTLSPLDISKDPKLSFVGIYDSTGNKVNGVKTNSVYYFKFSVIWPRNQTNGEVHVRLGEDNVPAIAMPYSIIGVDAIGPRKEYGLYYSDLESNSKDLQVMGRAGIKNKWANVIYTNPKGLNEFKVKVKIDDVQDVNKIILSYRANSYDGQIYVSDPKSSILVTDTRLQKLHSFAKTEIINVFSSLFECSSVSNICYSYKFVDGFVSYPEFSGVQDEPYALDLEFYSQTDLQAPLDFNANSLLQTVVLNNITSDLTSFSPSTAELPSLRGNLVLKANQHTQMRLYFTAKKVGTGSINMSSPLIGLSKNFDFRIDGPKNMTVTLNSNMIEFNKPIIFGVSDSTGKINNATINITEDNGTTSVFVQGNNTQDKGLDGRYVVNPLPAGIYNYEIRSQGHVTSKGNFIVTRFGVISVKQEYEIKIPVGKTQIDYDLEFTNISNLPLTKLDYQVLRDDAKAFNVNYRFLKSNLLPGATNKLIVSASVDATNVVYGDQDLVISGTINNNEVVRAIVHLIFVSNTDLDNSCLVVTPDEITANIYDSQREKFSGVLNLENNCEFDFQSLNPQLLYRENNELVDSINFSATSISLKRGEKKTIKYSMLSNIIVSATQSLELFINIDTGYFKKQIPVHAKLMHSFGALYISVSNPQLFLTASQIVSVPLFINNMGTSPLRNVTIMTQPYNTTPYTMQVPYSDMPQSSYYNPLTNGATANRSVYDPYNQYQDTINPYSTMTSQGMYQSAQTYVQPNVSPMPRTLAYVLPNVTAMSQLVIRPPATQKSNVVSAFTVRVQGYTVTDSKPVVAVTPIFVSISSPKCLKYNSPNPQGIFFKSSKLDITLDNENASITNQCAEPVQIDLPITKQFGDNTDLEINLENNVIQPMQTVNVKSTLYAGDELDSVETVQVKATGLNTKADFGFIITYNLALGRTAFGKEVVPYEEKEFSTCDDTNKKIQLKYPKVGQDCSSSYCDGQTAGDYIHGQILKYIKNYDSTVAKYAKNLSTTPCGLDGPSCSFEKVGVETIPFTLYLMHDKVTNAYLDEVIINDPDTHIKRIDLLPTNNFNIEQQSALQFNKLFVDNTIAECGKYTVQLEGAFAVDKGIPLKESFSLVLKTTFEKTPECEAEIQNAALFLPKDAKSQMNSTYNFSHAYVDYDKRIPELGELSKVLSKRLFSQERVASGKPNTLFLTKGTLGHFMDVSFDKEDNLVVTLDNGVDVSKFEEIIRNIEAFKQGNYDGCTKSNKREAQFTGAKDTREGQFKLGLIDKTLNLCSGTQSLRFNVLGSGAGTGQLYTYPSETKANGYTVEIKDKDGNPTSSVSFVKKENKEFTLEVNITDPSKLADSYKTEPLKLFLRVNSKELPPEVISLKQCGIAPSDFITKVINSDLKNSEYFGLINWTSGKDSKDGCQVIDEAQKTNEKISISAKTNSGSQCRNNNTKPLVSAIDDGFWSATAAATGTAMVACMGTDLVTSWKKILGPFSLLAAGITCGIVVGDLALTSIYSKHRTNVALGSSSWNWTDTLHDGANNWGLGWLFNNYDAQNTTNTDGDAAMNIYKRDATSWSGDDTETAVIGTATRGLAAARSSFGTTAAGAALSASELGVMNRFTDALSDALAKNSGAVKPGTTVDYSQIFSDLKKADPTGFGKSYDDLLVLATKKGIKPEQMFVDHLKTIGNNAFDEMATGAKALADAEAEQAKALLKKPTWDADLTRLNSEKTKIETALKKAKSGTKRYDTLKTQLDDTVKRIGETEKNLDDLVKLTEKINKDLDPKFLEGVEGAAKSVKKPGALGKLKRFWSNKWTNLGKGLLKGALSSIAAVESYNATWGAMMSDSLSKDKVVIIDLIVPDFFVKQKTYVLELTRSSLGTYSGIVKETDASNAENFCSEENSTRGYVAVGLLSETNSTYIESDEEKGEIDLSKVTGATYPSGCSNYSDLYIKYGEILSKNTDGKLDEKSLVALIKNESSFIPMNTSGTGAFGLGQFTRRTFCGYTHALANGKYSAYTSKFDTKLLLNYGAKDFKELFEISCVSKKEGKTQCSGGSLYYTKNCFAASQNKGKDPRGLPELSIMYMAMHLDDNYKSKKSQRAAIESYVIGPGCILGDGKYSQTADCKSNANLNKTIVPGIYWDGFLKNLKTADKCLVGGSSKSTTSPNTSGKFSVEGPILFVGDSITNQGYYKQWTNAKNSARCAVGAGPTGIIYNYLKSNCTLTNIQLGNKMYAPQHDGFTKFSDYKTAVVLASINDVANYALSKTAVDVATTKVSNNLTQIYAFLKSQGIQKVIAVTIPPTVCDGTTSYNYTQAKLDPLLNSVNSWIVSQSTSNSADYVVDLQSEFASKGPPVNWYGDCVHPGPTGQSVMAGFLAKNINIS